jgi:hypothetical protein
MRLNKITLALFVIYTIINVIYVIDLNNRLETVELTLSAVKNQATATSMLILAHIELHDVEERANEFKPHQEPSQHDLYQIYPRIRHD